MLGNFQELMSYEAEQQKHQRLLEECISDESDENDNNYDDNEEEGEEDMSKSVKKVQIRSRNLKMLKLN
ncbi:hypothetical protein NQ314_020948 [Rhamnusium bicolor]|uniref:Uncharacterized protein n=1 Tax=Rhamnusium bicolor TaxID=1586634 RepID=A0AAV8WJA2_9CUCU|nr:hypothetical protein NQ314_020948 [Rhamnusium bicolor]